MCVREDLCVEGRCVCEGRYRGRVCVCVCVVNTYRTCDCLERADSDVRPARNTNTCKL